MSKDFDWVRIKALWESGESAYAIAKRPNMPSRQSICKQSHREGWTVKDDQQLTKLPEPKPGGKLTAENRVVALELARLGLSNALICKRLGIGKNTLTDWCQADGTFGTELEAARIEHVAKQYGRIDRAGEKDWKAASKLLEVHPLTKEQWARNDGPMVQTNINLLSGWKTGIKRGVTIDQE